MANVKTDTPSYKFELLVGKTDLGPDLINVQIVNSISKGYSSVFFDLLLDPSDIILDKIFGKDPMKLSIKLMSRDKNPIPLESIVMELMYVEGDSPILQSGTNVKEDKTPKQRTKISIMTICRPAYLTMTAAVNEIVEKMTPKEAISMMVNKYSKAQLVYDTEGLNTDKIPQLLLPRGTLYNTINYIDTNFGLFNGCSNFGGYCQYDNKLYITNLTKKMTKDHEFIVHHLPLDSKGSEKIVKDSTDGKTFYTWGQIYSDYTGNTKFAGLGGTIVYNLKPFNKLFFKKEIVLLDFAKEFGAVFKGKMDADTGAKRKTFKTDITGDGTESIAAIKSRLAREIIGMATIDFQLEKKIPIEILMKVGCVVKFDTKMQDYIDLTGKYLLKSSLLVFRREANDWQSTAYLSIMRTNKTI